MTMIPEQTNEPAGTANKSVILAYSRAPASPADPYSDEALVEPWEVYRKLQNLGAAVWLSKYQIFALTRYDSVARALKDTHAFSSAFGVMMNDEMNEVLRGNTLCSDGEKHQRLRRLILRPMTAAGLDRLKSEITVKAEQLVERLVAKGQFCAVAELGTALPVDIIAHAVGLPAEGRERMLVWAKQMFNCFGPLNDRARAAFPVLQEMMQYATAQAVRGKLKPGSWAESIIDAVEDGEITEAERPVLMIDYMGPSLDTTICAIGSGVWLLAKHPEQWQKLREAPSRVASAVNEILRMEAPIQGFSRLLTRDYNMDGILLPAGSRAIAFYGAANRDERKFPRPHTFDVMRTSSEQLAFGFGPHVCLGQHLARLEMVAIFRALASRVKKFHIEEEVRAVNNVLRGFSKLVVSIE
jgi:cytochrome P450